MPEASQTIVQQTLEHYAMEIDGDEPGARQHRFRIEPIDPDKGSAVGYVAKYISKNIHGYQLEADEYGRPAEQAAERIEAWASVWHIRQFQQIGGPPVSIWRELRRAAGAPAGLLNEAWRAADAGKWAQFVQLMNGPHTRREALPVKLAKVWTDEPGHYGEPRGASVFGVQAGTVTLTTRIHVWTILHGGGNGDHGVARSAPVASMPSAVMAREVIRSRLATKPPLEFCQ